MSSGESDIDEICAQGKERLAVHVYSGGRFLMTFMTNGFAAYRDGVWSFRDIATGRFIRISEGTVLVEDAEEKG